VPMGRANCISKTPTTTRIRLPSAINRCSPYNDGRR
jgi:hypothetical protein